jgi:hypothetical protein
MGHQITDATARPFLHLLNSTRRPRQSVERYRSLKALDLTPHLLLRAPRSCAAAPRPSKRCAPACWRAQLPGHWHLRVQWADARRISVTSGMVRFSDSSQTSRDFRFVPIPDMDQRGRFGVRRRDACLLGFHASRPLAAKSLAGLLVGVCPTSWHNEGLLLEARQSFDHPTVWEHTHASFRKQSRTSRQADDNSSTSALACD